MAKNNTPIAPNNKKAGGKLPSSTCFKSGLLDSNQRPLRPERSALPTALNPDLRVQRYCTPIFALAKSNNDGAIAQLVEQRTENPCVPGSIPGGTTQETSKCLIIRRFEVFPFTAKQ